MSHAALSELQAALKALDAREGAEAGATDNSDVLRFQAAAQSLCTALDADETEGLPEVDTLCQGLDTMSNGTSSREAGAPNPFTLFAAFQSDISERTAVALRQREPAQSLQFLPLDDQQTEILPQPPAAGYQGTLALPPSAQLLYGKDEHGQKVQQDHALRHRATKFKIWMPGHTADSWQVQWYEARHIRSEQLDQMLRHNTRAHALEQAREAAERSSQPDAPIFGRAAR